MKEYEATEIAYKNGYEAGKRDAQGSFEKIGRVVNEKTTGLWDGIITIFSGYGENSKIDRFIATAFGTDDDKYTTLEDCRKMHGETEETITVIFDDFTHGEIYTFGNYGNHWVFVGITQGYA